jgi:hypothetical protein
VRPIVFGFFRAPIIVSHLFCTFLVTIPDWQLDLEHVITKVAAFRIAPMSGMPISESLTMLLNLIASPTSSRMSWSK